jgi:hypothetical protein
MSRPMPSNSPAPLPALGIETTAIIHDNLGVVLTYAFSRQALDDYRGWLMAWRWYFSDHVLLELPEKRANRAIIELAVMFRALDDVREITKHPYVATHPYVVHHPTGEAYGKLHGLEGEVEPLPLREIPNKVIHAKSIKWDFSNPREPLIICHAAEADYPKFRWTRAEVFVNGFAAVCAALAPLKEAPETRV